MNIVGIQGSPSHASRSASLLALALSRLSGAARQSTLVSVRELPAHALLHARFDHPRIRAALDQIAAADLLLIATPIYKAAYSGVLKAFLDLLPQDGLRGKTVLPLATGGSIAHLLALDYALKPVLSALGARDILDPVFATDAQMPRHDLQEHAIASEVVQRVEEALQTVLERAEALERRADAVREREALLARLSPAPGAPGSWRASDLRWAV